MAACRIYRYASRSVTDSLSPEVFACSGDLAEPSPSPSPPDSAGGLQAASNVTSNSAKAHDLNNDIVSVQEQEQVARKRILIKCFLGQAH